MHDTKKHEADADNETKEVELFSIEKKYTAKQIALIDNEIELDALVLEMKSCKGKLKAMTKRFEELKKLSNAHTFNPYADSE